MIFNNVLNIKKNILIVFLGESNSGGTALNSNATSEELAVNEDLKILENEFEIFLQPLNIENPYSNNLTGHEGLTGNIGLWHGWELQLSTRIKNKYFKNNDVFICKCGQGGTKVENWVDGVLYSGVDCKATFISRINAIKSNLNNNKTDVYVFFSLGINDAIAATNSVTWKSKMLTFINETKDLLGDNKIYATNIMHNDANYTAIDGKIDDLNDELSNFTKIQTSDASLKNSNHWDYNGMKLIANRMINNI